MLFFCLLVGGGELGSRFQADTNQPSQFCSWGAARVCLIFSLSIWNYKLEVYFALAGMAQLVGHQPANQQVTGSIPRQGTCQGCGPDPQLGACERQLIDVSLAHLCFSPFPSL